MHRASIRNPATDRCSPCGTSEPALILCNSILFTKAKPDYDRSPKTRKKRDRKTRRFEFVASGISPAYGAADSLAAKESSCLPRSTHNFQVSAMLRARFNASLSFLQYLTYYLHYLLYQLLKSKIDFSQTTKLAFQKRDPKSRMRSDLITHSDEIANQIPCLMY